MVSTLMIIPLEAERNCYHQRIACKDLGSSVCYKIICSGEESWKRLTVKQFQQIEVSEQDVCETTVNRISTVA